MPGCPECFDKDGVKSFLDESLKCERCGNTFGRWWGKVKFTDCNGNLDQAKTNEFNTFGNF